MLMHFLVGQTPSKAFCKCYPLNTAAGWQGGLRVTTLRMQSHVFKKHCRQEEQELESSAVCGKALVRIYSSTAEVSRSLKHVSSSPQMQSVCIVYITMFN